MALSDISKLTASAGFTERNDPFNLFGEWLKEAEASEPNDPNAMALATVDEEGLPNVRMVLLKGFDERGFVFYTNFESQKGQEILGTMKAALVLPLEVAAPPGAGAGHRGGGLEGGGGRIFRLAPARQPHRRLGLPAVAPAGKPLRARNRGGAQHREICDRRGAAPALLVGLPHQAAVDRVLARPALPAA